MLERISDLMTVSNTIGFMLIVVAFIKNKDLDKERDRVMDEVIDGEGESVLEDKVMHELRLLNMKVEDQGIGLLYGFAMLLFIL